MRELIRYCNQFNRHIYRPTMLKMNVQMIANRPLPP